MVGRNGRFRAPAGSPRARLAALAAAATAAFALAASPVALPPLQGPPPAAAAPRDEVERQQDEVEAQLGASDTALAEIGAELAGAAARLAELRDQVPAAQAEVARTQEAAVAARARDAQIGVELGVTEAQIEATRTDLAAREEEVAETEREVAGVVRQTYRSSDLDTLSILVEAGSPQEYADMLLLARTTRRAQDRTLAALAVQQADIRNAEALLEAQRERLEGLKAEAELQVGATEAAKAAARDAQAALEDLVAQQQQTVAGFEAARAAEEQRQADLERTSAALQQRLADIAAEEQRRAAEAERARRAAAEAESRPAPPAAGSSTRGGGGGGTLAYPVDSRISSPFGYRFHPILRYQRLHTGIDMASPCGTPVRASGDGEVVSAGWAGGYGNQVVIAHGQVGGVSLSTTYSHLTSFVVRSGSVGRGEVIAYSGTTGMSTGCHLHFETREAGVPVDPMNWLG